MVFNQCYREKSPLYINVVLDDGAFTPHRAHNDDGGLDLFSPVDIVVPARGNAVIDTGVHIELPEGTAGFLKSKSGLNVKHNITSDGVIDVGYTGSIVAKLYNHGDEDYQISRGDKITQLVIVRIGLYSPKIVKTLEKTDRGDGGFGSTGKGYNG